MFYAHILSPRILFFRALALAIDPVAAIVGSEVTAVLEGKQI